MDRASDNGSISNEAPHYLIRDRDRGRMVTRRLRAMGTRDKPIAPASPWQNSFAERLIGSIRRECVDHIVVSGEVHLRRILQTYACYYNKIRTHRSLDKDAPALRPVQRREHRVTRDPRWTSSPLRPGLGFRYTQVWMFGQGRSCKQSQSPRAPGQPLMLPPLHRSCGRSKLD